MYLQVDSFSFIKCKFFLYIYFIVLLFLIHLPKVNAQKTEIQNIGENTIYKPSTGVGGGILGSIIYPGFSVGIERPYKYTQVEKQKMRKSKTYFKERYLSYGLGMYHQSKYHTNYFLRTEWVGRKQKSKGFYFESSFGLGLSRTFVHGAAFTVEDNGIVEKAPMSGNWFALACFGGGIGYNANLSLQAPYSVFLKHNWLLMFPYNAFVSPRPTIELGVNYNLSSFWTAVPIYKTKAKQSRKLRKANI